MQNGPRGAILHFGAGSRNVPESLEAIQACFAACGSAPFTAGGGERPSNVHWTLLGRTGVPVLIRFATANEKAHRLVGLTNFVREPLSQSHIKDMIFNQFHE